MRFRSASRPDQLAQSLVRQGPIRGSPISAVLGVPQTVSNPKWSFRRSARADASLLQ